jgi:hypothetical protein
MDNLRNSRYRHAQIERQSIHAELQRFHEVCSQDLTRMDGWKKLL